MAPARPARSHLYCAMVVLLVAVPLVAVLFLAASASSSPPVVATLFPAASASSSPPVVAELSPAASASTSPPVVARIFPAASASTSPPVVAELSPAASASTSPPVVARIVPAAPASTSRPVVADLSPSARVSTSLPVVARFSPSACASSSPHVIVVARARLFPAASDCNCDSSSSPRATVRGAATAAVWPSASALSSPRMRNATTDRASGRSTVGNATVGNEITKTIDAEAQRTPAAPSAPSANSDSISPTTSTSTSTSSSYSPGRILLLVSLALGILAAGAGGWAASGGSDAEKRGSVPGTHDEFLCEICFDSTVFRLQCCGKFLCNLCLRDFVRDHHTGPCRRLQGAGTRWIVPLLHPRDIKVGGNVPNSYVHEARFPPWYFVKSVTKSSRLHLFYSHLEDLERGAEPRAMEVIHTLSTPGADLSVPVRRDVYRTMRRYSEL